MQPRLVHHRTTQAQETFFTAMSTHKVYKIICCIFGHRHPLYIVFKAIIAPGVTGRCRKNCVPYNIISCVSIVQQSMNTSEVYNLLMLVIVFRNQVMGLDQFLHRRSVGRRQGLNFLRFFRRKNHQLPGDNVVQKYFSFMVHPEYIPHLPEGRFLFDALLSPKISNVLLWFNNCDHCSASPPRAISGFRYPCLCLPGDGSCMEIFSIHFHPLIIALPSFVVKFFYDIRSVRGLCCNRFPPACSVSYSLSPLSSRSRIPAWPVGPALWVQEMHSRKHRASQGFFPCASIP